MEPAHLSAPSLSLSREGQADAPPASALGDLDVALTEASQNCSEAIFQVKMKRRKENLNPVSRGDTLNSHGSHEVTQWLTPAEHLPVPQVQPTAPRPVLPSSSF